MKKRMLGKSGLEVSALWHGCMGMSHTYGPPAVEHANEEMSRLELALSKIEIAGDPTGRTGEEYG